LKERHTCSLGPHIQCIGLLKHTY